MKGSYKITILLFAAGCLWFINLGWLAWGILLIGGFYMLFTSAIKPVQWLRKYRWMSAVLFFPTILVCAVGLRVFVMEIFNIPSNSMEATLIPGDYVLVSKLNYGPRMLRSPFQIPWFNLFFYLTRDEDTALDAEPWEYTRLSGFTAVKRNDVVVFQKPNKKEPVYIKRCVALPGDSFQMINGFTFCNAEEVFTPPSVKKQYQIRYNDFRQTRMLLDSLNIYPLRPFLGDSAFAAATLTGIERQKLLAAKLLRLKVISVFLWRH